MSRVRAFDEVTIDYGGTRAEALQIVCGKCGGVEYYLHKTGRSRKPPEAVMQNFRGKGWTVANRPAGDRCPSCARVKKPKTENETMVKPDAPARAETPKEMQRDDRRIITEKLDEVYGDNGYTGAWTDAGVARDLNVPKAWVSEVREAFFGAEGSNPLLEQYREMKAELDRAISGFSAERKTLCEGFDRLRNVGLDITKKADELRAIGKRIERELG